MHQRKCGRGNKRTSKISKHQSIHQDLRLFTGARKTDRLMEDRKRKKEKEAEKSILTNKSSPKTLFAAMSSFQTCIQPKT